MTEVIMRAGEEDIGMGIEKDRVRGEAKEAE